MAGEDTTNTFGVPLEEFEAGIATREPVVYEFWLYIAGLSSMSMRAQRNLRRILEEHLPDRHRLRVIDIYQSSEKAKKEQIIATPTVVKVLPLPKTRYVGDLSVTEEVLQQLGISIS